MESPFCQEQTKRKPHRRNDRGRDSYNQQRQVDWCADHVLLDWQNPVFRQDARSFRAKNEIDELASRILLLTFVDYSNRIQNRIVGIVRSARYYLNLAACAQGVGGIDDAGFDFIAHHIVQHLSHILGEDELGLNLSQQLESIESLFRILSSWYGLGITNCDLLHRGTRQITERTNNRPIGWDDENQ